MSVVRSVVSLHHLLMRGSSKEASSYKPIYGPWANLTATCCNVRSPRLSAFAWVPGSGTIRAGKVERKRRSMASQPSPQATAEQRQRTPVGTINVVDPNPLNWLFITWNTMEEPVRTDERGHIVGAVMEDSRWVDDTTFEVDVRRGLRFQDGEELTAEHVKRAFDEVQRWKAPHPPGTYLNFHPDATAEVVDDYKVRINFPEPDGLVLGKFRGMHIPSTRFWEEEGIGHRALGTGEGHW